MDILCNNHNPTEQKTTLSSLCLDMNNNSIIMNHHKSDDTNIRNHHDDHEVYMSVVEKDTKKRSNLDNDPLSFEEIKQESSAYSMDMKKTTKELSDHPIIKNAMSVDEEAEEVIERKDHPLTDPKALPKKKSPTTTMIAENRSTCSSSEWIPSFPLPASLPPLPVSGHHHHPMSPIPPNIPHHHPTSSRIVKGLFQEYENNNPIRPLSAYTNLGSPLNLSLSSSSSSSSSAVTATPATTTTLHIPPPTTNHLPPPTSLYRQRRNSTTSPVTNIPPRHRSYSVGSACNGTTISYHPHRATTSSSTQPPLWLHRHSPRSTIGRATITMDHHPSLMMPTSPRTTSADNIVATTVPNEPKRSNSSSLHPFMEEENGNMIRHHEEEEEENHQHHGNASFVSDQQKDVMVEAAAAKERQRIKKCELDEANITNIDDIKYILKKERYRTMNIIKESMVWKYMATYSQYHQEIMEEHRINTLMKRVDILQSEKERIIHELENEEEMITNKLQRQLNEVQREKALLEKQIMEQQEPQHKKGDLSSSLPSSYHQSLARTITKTTTSFLDQDDDNDNNNTDGHKPIREYPSSERTMTYRDDDPITGDSSSPSSSSSPSKRMRTTTDGGGAAAAAASLTTSTSIAKTPECHDAIKETTKEETMMEVS